MDHQGSPLHSALNARKGDFPGSPVAKNLPFNAGDVGSIPGRGTKIPHAVGQLGQCRNYHAHVPQLESPRATTTEPVCSGAHAPQLESPCAATTEPVHSRAPAPQLERSLRTTKKGPCTAMKGPTYRNEDPMCLN